MASYVLDVTMVFVFLKTGFAMVTMTVVMDQMKTMGNVRTVLAMLMRSFKYNILGLRTVEFQPYFRF